MVEYMDAIKKPITNMKTLLIGGLINIIPFFGYLLTLGFSLNVARETQKGNKELMDWSTDNIVKHIIDVIKLGIVALVYFLPAIIVFMLTAATVIISLITGLTTGNFAPFLMGITGAIGGVMIATLLTFILSIPFEMGIQFMVKENSVMAAFKFGSVLKKILTMTFLITFIVVLVYRSVLATVILIISMVLGLIPFVGWFISMFIALFLIFAYFITEMTLFAEVFNETP